VEAISESYIRANSGVELSHRYHKISANPILDAWRSGSACDSSNRDIHKVIRSNRVAFIGLTIHDCLISFAFACHILSCGRPECG
jgi:hypothetical protein